MTVTAFPKPPWISRCIMGKNGPVSNVENAFIAFEYDPGLRDAIAFDEMLYAPVLMHEVGEPMQPIEPVKISDVELTTIRRYIHREGLKNISKDNVYDAMLEFSRRNSFHPVRNYLRSLAWDGTARLADFLPHYFGTENTGYERMIGPMFLISMVARVMEPGCKADYMLVLESDQGKLKSQACQILGEPWFSDDLKDITASPKDASMHLRGRWLIEISELHAINKADQTQLKSFISRQEERYRPPYARMEVTEPRQCVFIGTTNKDTYLRDETGARRFWPAKANTINLDALRSDRNQLMAEATAEYDKGTGWWPEPVLEHAVIAPHQNLRYDADDGWEDPITEFQATKTSVTFTEILDVLDFKTRDTATFDAKTPINRLSKADQNRIKAILTKLGWSRSDRRDARGRTLWTKKA